MILAGYTLTITELSGSTIYTAIVRAPITEAMQEATDKVKALQLYRPVTVTLTPRAHDA